jgi:hypothetical protein
MIDDQSRRDLLEIEREFESRANARAEGVPALGRLLAIALRNSGQPRIVAAFLLCLYNGPRFKFDLTDLRCLDWDIFKDCIAVLKMDYSPAKEVHCYFPGGGEIFEKLARDWNMPGADWTGHTKPPSRHR